MDERIVKKKKPHRYPRIGRGHKQNKVFTNRFQFTKSEQKWEQNKDLDRKIWKLMKIL